MRRKPLVKSVYVSAPFARQEEAKFFAERVRETGWQVLSSWLDEDPDGSENSEKAIRDKIEVEASSLLVRLPSMGLRRTGGRFQEQGIALGSGVQVAIIGQPEGIMDYLPEVERFTDEEEFLFWLGNLNLT